MKFQCPHCAQRLAAEPEMAGREIACPACAATLTIPVLTTVPTEASEPTIAADSTEPSQTPALGAPASLPANRNDENTPARMPALPDAEHQAATRGSAAPPTQSSHAPNGREDPAAWAEARERDNDTTSASTPARRSLPIKALALAAAAAALGIGAFFLLKGKPSASGSLLSLVAGPPPAEVKVFPPEIHLSTKGDRQSLVVQAIYADGLTRDVTAQASYTLADRAIAKLDRDTLTPLADGKTELHVKYGGKQLALPVTVTEAKVERPISFKLDVMPVFMKAGCNAGACHGSSRGKDGFRLSLFGYDSDGDYYRLTRESIGRRLNLALPEESLLVEKALGRVPHTGGERFTDKSEHYATLMRWLRAGAPKDGTNVPKVVKVEMMPRQAVLDGAGAAQKLTVRANYSDGTDRDVTKLAAFFSGNETAAKVSESGVVTAGQRGEAFVTARFETHTVGAQMIVVPKGLKFTWPEVPEHNYIDTLVNAKLKKLRMTPSELCDDATFIRRASIDLTGTLPTPAQVQEFLDGQSAGKRDQLIEQLLERKEFADLWVMKFAELLQIRSNNDQFAYKPALLYYNWLQDRFNQDVPIDKIVQEILTASGSNFKNPAASYFQIEKDTQKIAENAAQVFMGMRIQCAQCHNHPFDRWTMNDYYSFASFFAQLGRKSGEDPREYILYDKSDGEVKHPVTGKGLPPKFLGGDVPEIGKDQTRREVLAKWLASPENPYFARNMANIVWAHFLGKGIIDPVDDVRVSNPASNPELLDALGAKFTEYKYDFKKLVRDICTSRTYQLSTRPNESNALDDRNFAHAGIRRLRAEVLLDSINQVTDTRDKFKGLPLGARAVQIADGNESSYFLTAFGRATRTTVCSCEVRTEPNLSQALHLLNGNTTQGKIADGGVVKKLLKEQKDPGQVIEQLYLRCLARKPTEMEQTKLLAFFKDKKDAEPVLNDVFWSLLNSKEFIFNH
jgi:hypothetical protein